MIKLSSSQLIDNCYYWVFLVEKHSAHLYAEVTLLSKQLKNEDKERKNCNKCDPVTFEVNLKSENKYLSVFLDTFLSYNSSGKLLIGNRLISTINIHFHSKLNWF